MLKMFSKQKKKAAKRKRTKSVTRIAESVWENIGVSCVEIDIGDENGAVGIGVDILSLDKALMMALMDGGDSNACVVKNLAPTGNFDPGNKEGGRSRF